MRRLVRWILSQLGMIRRPGVDLFQPIERKLYGYWNGKKTVWQDPLVLYKRIMEIGPDISIDIRVANSSMEGNIKASNSLMKNIRGIFDIETYSIDNPTSSGLTEAELTALLTHFLTYCEDVKKNAPSMPMSQQILVPSVPSSQPVKEPAPVTTSTSDIISTEEEKCIETPTPLPSESESPSDSSNRPLIILGPTQMERETPS